MLSSTFRRDKEINAFRSWIWKNADTECIAINIDYRSSGILYFNTYGLKCTTIDWKAIGHASYDYNIILPGRIVYMCGTPG